MSDLLRQKHYINSIRGGEKPDSEKKSDGIGMLWFVAICWILLMGWLMYEFTK